VEQEFNTPAGMRSGWAISCFMIAERRAFAPMQSSGLGANRLCPAGEYVLI
jgi:hypothetical protein